MLSGVDSLKNNPYPGRGIVIGKSTDESKWFQIYWIMGRSEQSRNRVFIEEGSTVYTKVFDESKVLEPELLIYPAVKIVDTKHIVTNGSHTNTIESFFKKGKTFFEAMLEETFEPDPPHFTPRIAGVFDQKEKTFCLAIAKSQNGVALREFFCYEDCKAGVGYCIHTYAGNGNPLPSFSGEPFEVPLSDNINEVAEFYWDLLDKENRISLLVKEINAVNNSTQIKIINKLHK